jgi:hypothetical protein
MDRIGLAIHERFRIHGSQKVQFTGCGVLVCSKLLIAGASAAKKRYPARLPVTPK